MRTRWFLFGLLLPFIFVAAFQWVIDPLFIFGRRTGELMWWKQPRISAAFILRRVEASGLSIGSSRNQSIPSNHRGWETGHVMQVVLPAATFTEDRLFIEHAHAIHPLRTVTVEMSYENVANSIPSQFNPDRLWHLTEPTNRLQYYVTMATDIARVLYSADSIEEGILESVRITWEGRMKFFARKDAWKATFGITTKASDNVAGNMTPQQEPMEELRKILAFGAEHNINMYFFLSPLRAPYEEEVVARYGFDAIEKWKRDLVVLFAEEARRTGRTYPLWDFSGYHTVTLEEVPPSGVFYDMRWFSDKAHFKEETGSMILDRLFGTCSSPCEIPWDFGVRLTPENIDAHLESIRAARAQYVKTHPQ